jgi:hypothetical protein
MARQYQGDDRSHSGGGFIFVRTRAGVLFSFALGVFGGVLPEEVEVNAGLLLLRPERVLC